MCLVPFGLAVLHAALVRVFGYTLEPATEGGRIPLGASDGSDEEE
jgi:hypothetical protein